jgi:hypothetical protein
MALVLSLRDGHDFYVADTQIIVGRVSGLTRFELSVPSTGKKYVVTDKESAEIVEDVFVSAGDRPQKGIARVAVTAPRSITIIRGDKYRAEREYST